MNNQLLKAAKTVVCLTAVLLFSGCSKNTIILDAGGDKNNSGNHSGSTLVAFNASVEGRNLFTRSMSPMIKGIQSRMFAYTSESSTKNAAPVAEGLYVTSSPGVLSGVDGYKMYLDNGLYNFYAVSDNFSQIPPSFKNGQSEPLFNGIDYLWWHNTQLDVTSSQIMIPITYQHAASQVVVSVAAGTNITLNKLVSAMITPPEVGASMELSTGIITPAHSIDPVSDKMGINQFTCQYIMLPAETTHQMLLTLELMVDNESTSRTYTVEIPLPDNALKAGNSYLFKALINENTIAFPSVSVKEWTEVDEKGNPLYPVQ
ncbi:MAG: hypothetical protein PARBA_00678 [Parabacteroides sp.]